MLLAKVRALEWRTRILVGSNRSTSNHTQGVPEMSTALQKAMAGEKVADGAAKGALAQAVDRLKSLQTRATAMKEKASVVGSALLHTAEMQGAAFTASFAEGYFGDEKMKIGPVDYRVGLGLAGGAVGLYQAFTGSAAGGHVLALSNGTLASAVSSFGRKAGAKMADKSASGAAPAAPAAPAPAPAPQQPQLQDFSGNVRDTFLTPETAADDDFGARRGGGRRGGRGGRRRPSRFLPVRSRDDEEEEAA